MKLDRRDGNVLVKALIYFVCIVLAVLSLFPFVVMAINSTRSTYQIQQHAVSLIPSTHLMENFKVFSGKSFDPWRGFLNSLVVAVGATVLTVYFSTLTATMFIYNQSFAGSYMYARGAAASMILFLIIAALSAVVFFLMRDRK